MLINSILSLSILPQLWAQLSTFRQRKHDVDTQWVSSHCEWAKHEDIVQSEISQTQKGKHYVCSLSHAEENDF